MAEIVGCLQGPSAMAVARQCGGRQRHGHGTTCGTRDDAVSTVGGDEEYLCRSRRNQEQLDIQGRDEDGDVSESLRTCLWQPLGLLTTVKPPALRERHDFRQFNCFIETLLQFWYVCLIGPDIPVGCLCWAVQDVTARL